MTTAYTETTPGKTILALLDELATVAHLHYTDHLPDRGGITVARLVEDLLDALPASGITQVERSRAEATYYLWAGTGALCHDGCGRQASPRDYFCEPCRDRQEAESERRYASGYGLGL